MSSPYQPGGPQQPQGQNPQPGPFGQPYGAQPQAGSVPLPPQPGQPQAGGYPAPGPGFGPGGPGGPGQPRPPKQRRKPGDGLIGPLTLRDLLLVLAGVLSLVTLATPTLRYSYSLPSFDLESGFTESSESYVSWLWQWAPLHITWLVLGVLPLIAVAVLAILNKTVPGFKRIGSFSIDQVNSALASVSFAVAFISLITYAQYWHIGLYFLLAASLVAFFAATLTMLPFFASDFSARPAEEAHPKARAAVVKRSPAPQAPGSPGPVPPHAGPQQPFAGSAPAPGQSQQPFGSAAPQPQQSFAPPQDFGSAPQPYGSPAPGQYGSAAPQEYGSAAPQGYGSAEPQQYGSPGPQGYGSAAPQEYGSAGGVQAASYAQGAGTSAQVSGAQEQAFAPPQDFAVQQEQSQHGSAPDESAPPASQGPSSPTSVQEEQGAVPQHGSTVEQESAFPAQEGTDWTASQQGSSPWAAPQADPSPWAVSAEPEQQATGQPAANQQTEDQAQPDPNLWASPAGTAHEASDHAHPGHEEQPVSHGASSVAGEAAPDHAVAPEHEQGAERQEQSSYAYGGSAEAEEPALVNAAENISAEEPAPAEETGIAAEEQQPSSDDQVPAQAQDPISYATSDLDSTEERANEPDPVEPTQVFRPFRAGQTDAGAEPAEQEAEAAPAAEQTPVQQAFWFAVPAPRPAFDPATGQQIYTIQPGAWFLALEDRGDRFVVRSESGQVGELRDIGGIQRG